MKARLFLLFPLIFLIFTSCNLDSLSNSTPAIFLNRPFNQHGDSLKLFLTDTGGELRLDTIQVGDTISMSFFLKSYSNNLTTFDLKQSNNNATSVILPDKVEMDSIFSSGSDYNSGKFLLKDNIQFLYFPFKYVAKQASSDSKLSFTVVSDAKFDFGAGSNTSSISIRTPIVVAKKK